MRGDARIPTVPTKNGIPHTSTKTAQEHGGAAAQKTDNGSMTEIEIIFYAMLACFTWLMYWRDEL